MDVLPDAFPSLEGRSLRSIEHKEREEGQREHPGETEEKCAELWILAVGGRVGPSCCVKEPYGRIYADPVAPLAIYVFLETVDN
jgi:hypothetical protein